MSSSHFNSSSDALFTRITARPRGTLLDEIIVCITNANATDVNVMMEFPPSGSGGGGGGEERRPQARCSVIVKLGVMQREITPSRSTAASGEPDPQTGLLKITKN